MTTEAPPALRPPGPAEHARRLARLQEALAAAGYAGAVITPSADLAYFTGFHGGAGERLLALIVPREGAPGLVVPAFERDRVEAISPAPEPLPWEEHEDPFARAIRFLQARGPGHGRVVLEPSMPLEAAERLREAAAGRMELRAGTALFASLRRPKEPLEQVLMEAAARRTHAALERTFTAVREGMTEREIESLLKEKLGETNPGGGGGGLVQVGPSAAVPHGTPGERRLREGDVLLVDCGTRVHGYGSDVTRTVVYGRAREEMKQVYTVVYQARAAGKASLSAGSPCRAADRAARTVIRDAGYGPFFTHRLGHGIGLEGHEYPYLVGGNTDLLLEGDTVTVEPGIYLPARFGVRIEDVALLSREGARFLGDAPEPGPGLREIG